MTPAVQSEDATPAYSAQWIYDTLMAEIEPDLTSENIVKLDEKYRDESEDDRKARMERYPLAFDTFNECLQDLAMELQIESMWVRAQEQALASTPA